MSETTTLPAPKIEASPLPRSKWEEEYLAFRRLLPGLLATQRRRYVAIHEGQVVDSGPDKLPLALRVLGKLGNVPIHVGYVSDTPEPVARSGVRRDLGPCGEVR